MNTNDAPSFITVQGRYGKFMVNRHDVFVGKSLIHYGEYIEHEWQLMQRFISTDDCVLDIGANIGGFSVPMARQVGASGLVHAFEPQPKLYKCLVENGAMNNLPQLITHIEGLGDVAATIETAVPDYDVQNNLGAFSFDSKGDDLQINIIPLDSLSFPKISFIKMDIEGMELKALMGAEQTIKRNRPIMYIENDKPEGASELIRWLEQHRYRLWWHTARLFNPDNFNKISENIFRGFRTVNMICVPMERIDLLPLVPSVLRPVKDGEETKQMLDGTIDSYCN